MDVIIETSIPVEASVAAVLTDIGQRAAIGRIVSLMLRQDKRADPLLSHMNEMRADAVRLGITQDIFDDETAAYNSELSNTQSKTLDIADAISTKNSES